MADPGILRYKTGDRIVSVATGVGVCARPGAFAPLKEADRVCVVTDCFCLKKILPAVIPVLVKAGIKPEIFAVEAGEKSKNYRTVERIHSFMLAKGFSRRSMLVAVGGGSVSDLTGFAAATFMRGIPWVCLPTTLLAQVDAGLGGKTGINLDGVKNVAGVFHQPAAVICDFSFLEKLGGRQRLSGMGEMIKCALVSGAGYVFLRKNWRSILALKKRCFEKPALSAIKFKAGTVARDETEKKELREILNFGHTAGHAFESLSRGGLSHGEAVIWGMRFACGLSHREGLMDAGISEDIDRFLSVLPVARLPEMHFPDFLKLVARDKKRFNYSNRFVLLKKPGRPVIVTDISPADIKETFKWLAEKSRLRRAAALRAACLRRCSRPVPGTR
ncbi:MAG: 3-dehydroquinate synthase family protein [bacterium]